MLANRYVWTKSYNIIRTFHSRFLIFLALNMTMSVQLIRRLTRTGVGNGTPNLEKCSNTGSSTLHGSRTGVQNTHFKMELEKGTMLQPLTITGNSNIIQVIILCRILKCLYRPNNTNANLT